MMLLSRILGFGTSKIIYVELGATLKLKKEVQLGKVAKVNVKTIAGETSRIF